MKSARVHMHGVAAGVLRQLETGGYVFTYDEGYAGPPISLTMPVGRSIYEFGAFPPFFDGLLPEGPQLEALLRSAKLDRHDHFEQLVTVGADLVGAVTVERLP